MNLIGLQKRHWPLAAVCLTAAIFSVHAAWIPIKAEVAQFLLNRSWHKTLAGDTTTKPWPWADTRALAILEVPRLGVREIVLQGSSGRNLAFGPTLLNTTPLGKTADRILSGHRDTHFRFMKDLENGDVLRLQSASDRREYRVIQIETVDTRRQKLVIEDDVQRLTLLTCYPFDAATADSPLRRVITALLSRVVPGPQIAEPPVIPEMRIALSGISMRYR